MQTNQLIQNNLTPYFQSNVNGHYEKNSQNYNMNFYENE